jgi:hypothetical protein
MLMSRGGHDVSPISLRDACKQLDGLEYPVHVDRVLL